ncbi:hypothetical protein [Nakamurella leprariae]|uniref:LPXTG cell wall anchor domain-containing protein n=1 Tax=Nakamurella leprariae TaxID=2803911 RepID=A0A938YA79_9ACTN|nr:hypothetical protein [Nakamurella leprariae]MBM9466847.1 hypothetical protein [Nakamurella leprariae]
MKLRALSRATVVAAGAALALTVGGGVATAAPTPTPSPDCKVPNLTANVTSVSPGTSVTLNGQNFSGCAALDNPATPSPQNEFAVGIGTADQDGIVLATGTTAADGTFSVTVTIPAVPAEDVKEGTIVLAAVSADPVTTLNYTFALPVAYSSGAAAAPTAVPAGSGGAAGTDSGEQVALLAAGAAGLGLLAAGAVSLSRRRAAGQRAS